MHLPAKIGDYTVPWKASTELVDQLGGLCDFMSLRVLYYLQLTEDYGFVYICFETMRSPCVVC